MENDVEREKSPLHGKYSNFIMINMRTKRRLETIFTF